MNTNMTDDHTLDPAQLLKWYVECGVDETIAEEPINWFNESNKSFRLI